MDPSLSSYLYSNSSLPFCRYLGFVLLLWVLPMSTLLLIFLPKYSAYRKALRGVHLRSQPVRGQRKGAVVVSGFSANSNKSNQSATGSSTLREPSQISHEHASSVVTDSKGDISTVTNLNINKIVGSNEAA